jgi:ubiquinone/menaquinone biosynthesis C-methylase UbiE
MLNFDHSILRCPNTSEHLSLIPFEDIKHLVTTDTVPEMVSEKMTEGFINTSKTYFYPVVQDVILLLPLYALNLSQDKADKKDMHFDKERVFRHYNEIGYKVFENAKIYDGSDKWVDYRAVSIDYFKNSFRRAKKYLDGSGQYYLDIASGPIGFQEYLDLSEKFDVRICIDIAFNPLVEAQHNMKGQKGIFICGDITNIPLQDNVCDAVLSQHTLYHIPRKEQKTAVEEMYRVAKEGGTIGIVYNWFFYSIFSDILLLPYQIYRVARHYAGKVYVRMFNSKPRLYFYCHPHWWFNQFPFKDKIEIYCWRSAHKNFVDFYIHEKLFGKQILNYLQKIEDKYPKTMGIIGDYPIIVIKK